MITQIVSIADLRLPPDFVSWGLKPAALEVLKVAFERQEISVRDIAALISPEIGRDHRRFRAIIAAIGNILKSRETRLVADSEEVAYRERFPIKSAQILKFEMKSKGKLKPQSSRESNFEELVEDRRQKEKADSSSIAQRKTQLLSHGEEQELIQKIVNEQDLVSRNKLVEHNLRLVHWMVQRKFRWALQKIEYDDLVGYGNEGLIKAAGKFRPLKGNRFATYAIWWIRQRISQAIFDEGDLIRIPIDMHRVRAKILKVAEVKAAELGRVPTLEEIAQESGLPKKKIERVLCHIRFDVVSLNQEIHGSRNDGRESTIGDFIPDTTTANPRILIEARQELAVAKSRIDEVLASLTNMIGQSKRNIDIFKMVYGFDGSGSHRKFAVVGQQYGMSSERVSQIVRAIWQKINDRGSDMSHDRLLEELERVDELEKIATSID